MSQRASSFSVTTKLPGASNAKRAEPLRVAVSKSPVSAHRPSSRRKASQDTVSGETLSARRWPATASPSVRLRACPSLSPDLRRTEERWARWATCSRSASTGAAKAMILSTVVLAAAATASGVSPARMRVWMSRGRRTLSISISN